MIGHGQYTYKMATEFMLAHPYGFTRVMSSYDWPRSVYIQDGHRVHVGPSLWLYTCDGQL